MVLSACKSLISANPAAVPDRLPGLSPSLGSNPWPPAALCAGHQTLGDSTHQPQPLQPVRLTARALSADPPATMNFSHAMTLRVLPLALACLTALTVQARAQAFGRWGHAPAVSSRRAAPAGGAADAAVRQADYIVAVVNSGPSPATRCASVPSAWRSS